MSTKPLATPAPIINVETRVFWDATNESKLLLPRCMECGATIWYPRSFCPQCSSRQIDWIEASGRGTIYSYTINRRGQDSYAECSPYVLAYVELEEGPRILTNILDWSMETIRVGLEVRVVFSAAGREASLVRFTPATGNQGLPPSV